eukprot:5152865-Pyramimonas_sp.AAC.2
MHVLLPAPTTLRTPHTLDLLSYTVYGSDGILSTSSSATERGGSMSGRSFVALPRASQLAFLDAYANIVISRAEPMHKHAVVQLLQAQVRAKQ